MSGELASDRRPGLPQIGPGRESAADRGEQNLRLEGVAGLVEMVSRPGPSTTWRINSSSTKLSACLRSAKLRSRT